jgi:hypothetical protein
MTWRGRPQENWIGTRTPRVSLSGPHPHSMHSFNCSIFKILKNPKSTPLDPDSGIRLIEFLKPVCGGLEATSCRTEPGEKT